MTVTEFLDKYITDIENGWIIAALTDKYLVDCADSEKTNRHIRENAEKVLDIRIFDKNAEHRLFRTGVGDNEFYQRSIYDRGEKRDSRDYYDEVQFLDIDEKKGHEGGFVKTTGGGKYYLPLNRIVDAKIRIRYYLGEYEGSGQARIMDWRVVELMEGK